MKLPALVLALAGALSLLVSPLLHAATPPVTPEMIGHWEGSADIVVAWTKQRQLPVVLDLQADGTVTGRIGDARLVDGHFSRNRGWLGRQLNLATDYIVRGRIEGPVIAAEDITRDTVSLPLWFEPGRFTGAVHTGGSKFGGKERMILSAFRLQLKKTP